MSTQIFSGLRVVEFAEGMSGPMVGMVMADNGAEVIKVETPESQWHRESPGFLMWNRGKKGILLDLEKDEDRRRAVQLALTADVVLESFAPGQASKYGLDYANLSRERKDFVHCTLTGFGVATQHEHLAPRAEIVVAKSGRANGNTKLSGAHFTGRPTLLTSPYGMFGAAGLALEGIVGALLARDRTGQGQAVETSLLDGLVITSMRFPFKRSGDKVVSGLEERWATPLMKGVTLCFMTAECKDGRYIQMCARQDKHFKNWLKATGLEHLLADERFKDAPIGMKTGEDVDALDRLLRERMLTKTQEEWMQLFSTTYDAGSDPFLTSEEFLAHPQMVLNGRIVELDDARFGKVRQVGALVNFSDTPSKIQVSAPAPGEHQAELDTLLKRRPAIPANPKAKAGELARPPFEGITILDLATFIAAPLGATLLAELGARVIKIEPPEGDSYRKLGLESVHLMHGKESLAIDLKAREGREVFERIARKADALVHNFRPGVPERLGVGYESVHRINPRLVYLYGGSYGTNGPQNHRPAFHSTPHALNGAGLLQGGAGNPPIDDSYPDPVAAVGVAMALAMGLYAREKTGVGQYMETTMLTSSGYVQSEWLTHYAGMPNPPVLDREQLGLDALNRIYPTADKGWFMLSALRQVEWERLANAVGHAEWLNDPALKTAAQRRQRDATLQATLKDIFAQKDSETWERILSAAGIPGAAVYNSYEQFMVDHKLVEPEEYSIYSYWRQKPRVRYSASQGRHGMPCVLGEHTLELLSEFNYSESEIAALVDKRIVKAA